MADKTRVQTLLDECPLPRDNPSGCWCISCHKAGISHCSDPEHCGGMIPIAEATKQAKRIRADIIKDSSHGR